MFNSLFYVKCKYMLLITVQNFLRNFVRRAEKCFTTNTKFDSAAECAWLCLYVCMCDRVRLIVYVCMCVCVFLCMYVYVFICVFVRVFVYVSLRSSSRSIS